MVSAIIFDLYGVLAINGWQAFKAEHYHDRENLWDDIVSLGKQVDAGLSDYEELVRFTAEATGVSEATVRYQLEHTVANAALIEFIQNELQGSYKLGILSNASNEDIIEHLFTPEQQELFDEIVLSTRHGIVKPDPQIYHITADKLGIPAEACLFIDDQERHASGAKEAGMQALVYHDLDDLKQELMHRL